MPSVRRTKKTGKQTIGSDYLPGLYAGRAVSLLLELGLRVLRVRYHGDVARIVLGPEEFDKVVNGLREDILVRVKGVGFDEILSH